MTSVNLNSETACRNAYINYYYRGNSCGYTANEIGRICQKYGNKTDDWEKVYKSDPDTTNYEITDDERDEAKTDGYDYAQTKTGDDGDHSGSNWSCAGSAVCGVGGLTFSLGSQMFAKGAAKGASEAIGNAAADAAKTAASKATTEGGKKFFGKAAEKGGDKAASSGAEQLGSYIAIALAIINVAVYFSTKPYEEEAEACEAYTQLEQEAQAELAEQAGNINNAVEESEEIAEEATEANEEGNELIEDSQTDREDAVKSMEKIQEKIENGEALTDEEKQLYDDQKTILEDSTQTTTDVQDEMADIVENSNKELKSYNRTFKTCDKEIAYATGEVEAAAQTDKATKIGTIVEAASQGANAISATVAAGKLCATGCWWNYIIAAVGFGAAIASGYAVAEQIDRCSKATTAIETRETTEAVIDTTQGIYDTDIKDYARTCEIPDNLTLDIPKNDEDKEEELTQEIDQEVSETESGSGAFGLTKEDAEDEPVYADFGIVMSDDDFTIDLSEDDNKKVKSTTSTNL